MHSITRRMRPLDGCSSASCSVQVSATLPWKNLKGQPTIVSLDKIYLIVGPKASPRRRIPVAPPLAPTKPLSVLSDCFAAAVQTAADFDAKAEQARAVDLKRKRIDEAEEKRHAALDKKVASLLFAYIH